jgi:signal transduction histidine kinase
MNDLSRVFRRRLTVLVVSLVLALLTCVSLAVVVRRNASNKLQQLAQVELEAALQARQFRAAVDDLHGALLRIGIDPSEDCAAVIEQRRQVLSAWLSARQAADLSPNVREIVLKIAVETRSYFVKLDALAARTRGLNNPLDRDTVVMFDDSVNRLQSIADDFAAAHDDELRRLLGNSLSSLRWMRNLVFGCLGLLLAAIAAVVVLLYRDVVRPLRQQLVDRETLLAKREKLAALGTLAAGVAHEIRNPLTAIKARLYTLRRVLSSDESKEDVQAITGEVDRLERIVRDVLGYARPADAALGQVELSVWLREFAAFVKPELTATKTELAVDTAVAATAEIDPNQLRQVMLNLVRNAQEAFEGRPGRIELALRLERLSLRGKLTDVAVLAVTDNGPGIPAKIQPRLFDPFFTTKAMGTGLGLSIVARLVENQGGEITFQSAPGTGTRFDVCLPIIDEARQTRGHERSASHLPDRR